MVCLHTGTMGSILCAFLSIGQGKLLPRSGIRPENTPPILRILPFCRAPTGGRQETIDENATRSQQTAECRGPFVQQTRPLSEEPRRSLTGVEKVPVA